jgi:hypothetical protein
MTNVIHREIFHSHYEAKSAADRLTRKFPALYLASVKRAMCADGSSGWLLTVGTTA